MEHGAATVSQEHLHHLPLEICSTKGFTAGQSKPDFNKVKVMATPEMDGGSYSDENEDEDMYSDSDSDDRQRRKRKRLTAAAKSKGQMIRTGPKDPANCRNQTGYIGVRMRKWGMYAAEIRDGDKRRWLGSFGTAKEAGIAYDAAAIAQKNHKAKTNFRYLDYISAPRANAETVERVRWDFLPKEILERFPIPAPTAGLPEGALPDPSTGKPAGRPAGRRRGVARPESFEMPRASGATASHSQQPSCDDAAPRPAKRARSTVSQQGAHSMSYTDPMAPFLMAAGPSSDAIKPELGMYQPMQQRGKQASGSSQYTYQPFNAMPTAVHQPYPDGGMAASNMFTSFGGALPQVYGSDPMLDLCGDQLPLDYAGHNPYPLDSGDDYAATAVVTTAPSGARGKKASSTQGGSRMQQPGLPPLPQPHALPICLPPPQQYGMAPLDFASAALPPPAYAPTYPNMTVSGSTSYTLPAAPYNQQQQAYMAAAPTMQTYAPPSQQPSHCTMQLPLPTEEDVYLSGSAGHTPPSDTTTHVVPHVQSTAPVNSLSPPRPDELGQQGAGAPARGGSSQTQHTISAAGVGPAAKASGTGASASLAAPCASHPHDMQGTGQHANANYHSSNSSNNHSNSVGPQHSPQPKLPPVKQELGLDDSSPLAQGDSSPASFTAAVMAQPMPGGYMPHEQQLDPYSAFNGMPGYPIAPHGAGGMYAPNGSYVVAGGPGMAHAPMYATGMQAGGPMMAQPGMGFPQQQQQHYMQQQPMMMAGAGYPQAYAPMHVGGMYAPMGDMYQGQGGMLMVQEADDAGDLDGQQDAMQEMYLKWKQLAQHADKQLPDRSLDDAMMALSNISYTPPPLGGGNPSIPLGACGVADAPMILPSSGGVTPA